MTKAPPWHGWVAADLSLNSLSTGVFAVAALCDLFAPADYRAVVRLGYLAAFPIVFCDLVCLIFDLGDPIRFLHMLRVFKLKSPMSLGAWSTNAFAFLAFIALISEIGRWPRSVPARAAIAVAGLIAALTTASYKGVLLSMTAQPGWKDARWLGAELAVSSGTSGTAFLLCAAATKDFGHPMRGLSRALMMLLVLNTVLTLIVAWEMRDAMAARFTRVELAVWRAAPIAWSLIVPLAMLAISRERQVAIAASVLTVLGVPAMRHNLVAIPQRDSWQAPPTLA